MGASLAASRFVNQVNKKSFQEKADIWDLFCMTYYYQNCGGQNVKMKPPDPPPFDKQFKEVQQCISEQLEDILRRLHSKIFKIEQQQQQQQITAHSDFSLLVKESSVDHTDAGKGVFISGTAVPGTVVMFHPGLVIIYTYFPMFETSSVTYISHYSPFYMAIVNYMHYVYLPPHIRKMPHYPAMDQKSTYLVSRYDGCIIDPNGFNGAITTSGNVVVSNPLAVGHMMNHPPTGMKPNVMPFSYNVLNIPKELLYLVPNKYYKEPGFFYKTPALMRSVVYITINHVCNEELFVNYRLNPNSKLPEWYTPVNKEEDSRRWNT